MRYLELSEEAKNNALLDYMDLMNLQLDDCIDLAYNHNVVIEWFKKYNHDIFNEKGLLIHRKR